MKLLRKFRVRVAQSACFNFVAFADALNGLHCFTINGLRNHRQAEVFSLFQWLAKNGPGSYGLLYIHDFEDNRDDNAESFRVWRLVRGNFTEHTDPFLSPVVPTLEDAYVSVASEEHHNIYGHPTV